jgi:hypothetical protein
MPPARIPGPYFVGGGDGSDYFAVLPPEPALLNAYRLLIEAQAQALRVPGGEGKARALAIDVTIRDTQVAIDRVAAQTAALADQEIKQRIIATQVRPDAGAAGRPRLRDAIVCRPLTIPGGGGVGIGDLSELDRVADASGQAFWRAQEFGSTHNVGREVKGLFQPGNSRPSASEFRNHPVFTPGRGPKMIIQRPIPERAFLREGAATVEAIRQRRMGDACVAGIAELRLIQSGNHPRLKAARRFVSSRRIP